MKSTFLCAILVVTAGLGSSPAKVNPEAGSKAEQNSCLPCHSLRLIESQRLSAGAWQKEVDKMIGWGAVVSDRQLLINYLSEQYSNTLPPPAAVLSEASK